MNDQTGSAYPKNETTDANRWYNKRAGILEGNVNLLFIPTSSFHIPNANEMSWYAMKGDPRWDGDELWTTMGHLYKGGMWFKKMNKIISDNTTEIDNVKTVAGVSTREEAVKARGIVSAGTYDDYRTNGHSINSTPTNLSTNPIPAADANNYFYLPALGDYYAGE